MATLGGVAGKGTRLASFSAKELSGCIASQRLPRLFSTRKRTTQLGVNTWVAAGMSLFSNFFFFLKTLSKAAAFSSALKY